MIKVTIGNKIYELPEQEAEELTALRSDYATAVGSDDEREDGYDEAMLVHEYEQWVGMSYTPIEILPVPVPEIGEPLDDLPF